MVSDTRIDPHDVVVHAETFVSLIHPDIHTENIENIWNRVKRQFKKKQVGKVKQSFGIAALCRETEKELDEKP